MPWILLCCFNDWMSLERAVRETVSKQPFLFLITFVWQVYALTLIWFCGESPQLASPNPVFYTCTLPPSLSSTLYSTLSERTTRYSWDTWPSLLVTWSFLSLDLIIYLLEKAANVEKQVNLKKLNSQNWSLFRSSPRVQLQHSLCCVIVV